MLQALANAAAAQEVDRHLDHETAKARGAFNEAIRAKRVGAIKRLLMDDVVLITGSDSGPVLGRDKQLEIWRRDFENPDRLIFQRTPHFIAPSPIEPIATELGTWSGKPERPDGREISGDYTAKWRQVKGVWLVEAEIYTTMSVRQALTLG